MKRLGRQQAQLLTRAALLINGWGHHLSEHERETCQAAGDRFRKVGDAAVVSEREWPVIEDAVAAMEAARDARGAA